MAKMMEFLLFLSLIDSLVLGFGGFFWFFLFVCLFVVVGVFFGFFFSFVACLFFGWLICFFIYLCIS